MTGFGRPDSIETLLTSLHNRFGQIQLNSDYSLVKAHWQIAQSMNRCLEKWSQDPKLTEIPISYKYIRSLELIFYPNDLKEIFGRSDWLIISNTERFKILFNELEKIHNWTQRIWILGSNVNGF